MTDPTYIGSISGDLLQLAHPKIYARLEAGKTPTRAQMDEIRRSPWLVQLYDTEKSAA